MTERQSDVLTVMLREKKLHYLLYLNNMQYKWIRSTYRSYSFNVTVNTVHELVLRRLQQFIINT